MRGSNGETFETTVRHQLLPTPFIYNLVSQHLRKAKSLQPRVRPLGNSPRPERRKGSNTVGEDNAKGVNWSGLTVKSTDNAGGGLR
jgi:hypothetical protein